jgi:hypothetical protein
MFSLLKKKDDEYKQNKVTYPVLGLILGGTLGYYAPFVFLFTKFLSVTAMGGIGSYTGLILNDKELEECYYKKCAFDKYNAYNDKFELKDYLFRKHMMSNNKFNINYSYKILVNNIEDGDHLLSKCYNDMKEYYMSTYKDDIELNTQKFLNFYFYHMCQYYIHVKSINVTKNQLEMVDISNYKNSVKIDNKLLEVFDTDNEIFLKLYISTEKIILDDIGHTIREDLYDKYNKEDKLVIDKSAVKLNEECIDINTVTINKLWLELFESNTPYEKLSIFYKINVNISEEVFKTTKKRCGADEILPILIHSVLLTGHKNIYSEYMFLQTTYNDDIYNNIFEFLMVKYMTIMEYLIK